MEKAIRYAAVGLAVVVTLIVAASYANQTKYYLKTNGDVLEVWKGRFSPIGAVQIAQLPGRVMQSPLKDTYTEAEASGVAFSYFISKADDLLAADVPDLVMVRSHLDQARMFAYDAEYMKAVESRFTTVSLMESLYRADAAAAKGSPADYRKALGHLEEAAALPLTEAQALIVEKRAEAIRQLLQAAEGAPVETTAETPAATAPEKPAAAPADEHGAAAPEKTPAEKVPGSEKGEASI